MDDGVGALHGRLHARRVGDVALDDLAAEALEILGTTGVTDETPHGKLVRAQGGGYVPADETRGAGEQNHGFSAAAAAAASGSAKFCQYRDGVGPVWPLYLEPSPLAPYGASAGSVIWTNESCPIFMPT